jgi:hypothetical protein
VQIRLPNFDTVTRTAYQVTVPQGTTTIALAGAAGAKFTVESSNPALASVSVTGTTLSVTTATTEGGRAALRLVASDGATRYVGLRVRDGNGALPGFPKRLSVGVVSEDGDADLGMFKSFTAGERNMRVDNRYIYLNNGVLDNSWWNWDAGEGSRARKYLRNSLMLGIIPTFVWYNIPDGGESYDVDSEHMRSRAYMEAYFKQLRATLAIVNEEAPGEPVMFVLEPDFLGYMMQLSGKTPSGIAALGSAALSSGVLDGADPVFPDTLQGLVGAINYTIHKYAPQVRFGWQINVWASLSTSNAIRAPKGLMKITDSDNYGWAAGRQRLADEAMKVYAFYNEAGIASHGASFISFDKYGLDAVGFEANAAADPNHSYWFYNADHWNNYLLYVKTLHDTFRLPVALWQMPVGRINGSLSANPHADGGRFADLDNAIYRYEDSTASYFLGDTFAPGSTLRNGYFSENQATDPLVSSGGGTVTWGAHMKAAADAGVFNIMFGDGVGISTRARPLSPGGAAPDGWWLMTNIQRYLKAPVPLSP